MVPAAIKSTPKPNHVLAININRMTYHVHMPLLLYYVLTIYSLLSFYHKFVQFKPGKIATLQIFILLIVFGPHVPPPEPHTDSEQELACNVSRTHIPWGRSKKERYQCGEARQHAPRAQEYLCSTCSQPGYNSRTCRTPHD